MKPYNDWYKSDIIAGGGFQSRGPARMDPPMGRASFVNISIFSHGRGSYILKTHNDTGCVARIKPILDRLYPAIHSWGSLHVCQSAVARVTYLGNTCHLRGFILAGTDFLKSLDS